MNDFNIKVTDTGQNQLNIDFNLPLLSPARALLESLNYQRQFFRRPFDFTNT